MFEGLLSKGLSMAGYVPAAELAKKVTELREMTIARDEMARRNASSTEHGAALALKYADLEARYNNILAEYEADIQKWNGERDERQRLQIALDTANEQIESANEVIRVLQSERPQMRIVRNEKPLAGDESEGDGAPAEDEVLVAMHTVEMYARVIVISFEGKTYWTLSVGDHQFKVAVHDRAFLEDPTHRFAKGSVIRAEFLETTLRRAGDGEPYTIRSLERVIEVIQPSPQTTEPLFDDAATAASVRS